MSDQDDEKKILNEDTAVSESENQPSVDQKNQPESAEGQNNDPNSNSNDSWKVPSCSCFTLTTFSNVVSRTLVEESKALTVPVWVVKVLLTANVPDTSFKTKWALNVKSGGLVSL
mgnify:CR=1 FL=1